MADAAADSAGGQTVPINTVLMNSPFRGLNGVQEVYFIGIGGIGMSALARFFAAKGVKVSGYDKTPTPLTRSLEQQGIVIHYEENLQLIPAKPDLVVYTPAIPAAHQELVHYRQSGVKVVKRSDVLQLISESSFNICVAGTHGKTTITTMIAHLLRHSGFGCNAFLGGISVNYDTNFWSDPRNVCVIEADEFDRSFLKLSPDIAVISAMDADHLDIYGTADAVEQAFIDFSKCIKPGGTLVMKSGLKRGGELSASQKLVYGLKASEGGAYAANVRTHQGSYTFDAVLPGKTITDVTLHMGGMHNVENVMAAIAVADRLGVETEKIREAVEAFRGVKRRFEYVLKNETVVFVDDYAHHPQELEALIGGARHLFTDRKATIIFQPHLFTRTRDFAEGFAAALDGADEVILLPIYPARELPIQGVASEMIQGLMKRTNAQVLSKEAMLKWVSDVYKPRLSVRTPGLLIAAGAGDIDALLADIKERLTVK